MSKGLGRGLSSLFAVYDEDKTEVKKPAVKEDLSEVRKEKEVLEKVEAVKPEPILEEVKPVEKVEVKPEIKPITTVNLDILNSANNLLEKYQKKDLPKQEEPENLAFISQKASLEEKLRTVETEMYGENGVRQIPINRLQPNPDQPRKNFSQESLSELAQSIREHGIIQPIIAVAQGDHYIIIAGERRYRAARIVGLKTVPVILRDYDDRERREIALIENLQREDLNPIETALAIKQLIDTYGFTQDEVGQKIGKSRPVIANTLRLLNLEPEVLVMVEKGRLSQGIAKALVSLPREDQIALAKKSCDGKMTSRDVEKAAQMILRPEAVAVKKAVPLSAEMIAMKDDLQQVFGTKVTILGNNRKGRIYFDYYNQDDLDRIYSLVNQLK